MQIVCTSNESALTLAKRILFLAYEASSVFGMGAFQARDAITEDEVWANTVTKGDYGGFPANDEDIYADYVFGRMMKLSFHIKDNTISYDGIDKTKLDYQSWGAKYKTYTKLFQAAIKSLNMTVPINP
jgi:hypothetical protein